MIGVYEKVPIFENERWLLRKTDKEDANNLLEVYSDLDALPLFNSDNCNGDRFHYDTLEKMERAIDFWDFSYKDKWFVRWSIVDKACSKAIGTIELFHRSSTDYYNGVGLLRLDLRSDYETENTIMDILSLIIEDAYNLFECNKLATKAIDSAIERIRALEKMGFSKSDYSIVGHDGTEYRSYYVR